MKKLWFCVIEHNHRGLVMLLNTSLQVMQFNRTCKGDHVVINMVALKGQMTDGPFCFVISVF